MSASIALPFAAAIFGSGDQITHMAKIAGWGTFFIEHLIYGLTLGVLLGAQRSRAGMAAPSLRTGTAH